jgi:hypothetical protein
MTASLGETRSCALAGPWGARTFFTVIKGTPSARQARPAPATL